MIEADDAARWLAGHLGHPVELESVGEGMWSRAYGFSHGGRALVVRFGEHRDDFEADRRAASFASPSLPVPELLEIGDALGRHFAISTRVHGFPLESLDADGWRAVLPSLFDALDAMRALPAQRFGDCDESGTGAYETWPEFLLAVDVDVAERRIHGWRSRLSASPVGLEPFDAAYARMEELAGHVEPHVVHGDLINRNVLVADDRLTGVFDWGCTINGDALYDIAWIEFWSPWYPALAEIDLRGEARRRWADDRAEDRLLVCLLHIGLGHLAYCSWAGDEENLVKVAARTVGFTDL